MATNENNKAMIWNVDPEVLKRAEEQEKKNAERKPREDKTRDDAARLWIELPPLPQWASAWLKRPLLQAIDLDERFRAYTDDQKQLLIKYPIHCVVWCVCCNDFRVVLGVGQDVFQNRFGNLRLVTLLLSDSRGHTHVSCEERVKVVGYKRGLEPAVMEALFNPPCAVN